MPKGADFLVSCLNPDHADRNPSMRIDNITGIYQCFSCEYKGNVFTHFGQKANQLQLRRELLINFPIRDISGRIVAFNGRHTTGGTPKYMISPAGAKMPLFPIVVPIHGKIILVEGIYDMLNLQDKGLTNAVCTFGTKNINEDKLRMLSIQGVDGIDIFFDGDDAGQHASERVQEMCEQIGLPHRNICLQGKDPGGLTETTIQKLKRKLYA